MADDNNDFLEDEELMDEVVEDNAKSLTDGAVYVTTVMLVLAIVVMMLALGEQYGMGVFKPT